VVFDSISNERGLGGRVTSQLGMWEEHRGTPGVIESDRYALSKQNLRLSTTCQLWEQQDETHQWHSCSPSAPSLRDGCGRCQANSGAADAPGQAGVGSLPAEQQGEELQPPGSSLQQSIRLSVNIAAGRAGLDWRAPLGATASVNTAPGRPRR